MGYDTELASRIRDLVFDEPDLTEKKMFGGLAFLVGGRMAVAASGQGGLMVRVDPTQAEELLAGDGVAEVGMRGRVMSGWLRVGGAQLSTDEALETWIKRGVEFAKTLPAKK